MVIVAFIVVSPATDELVGQDSCRPHVNSASEWLDLLGLQSGKVDLGGLLELCGRIQKDLWGHVVQSPTARKRDFLVPVHGKAEITQPHGSSLREEDILGLDVPMHEMKRVHLLQDS